MRFLVTAGNTREKIDRVRDWGNIFTGNTGLRIARALTQAGEVDLLTSNARHLEELPQAGPIRGRRFTNHADLRDALSAMMKSVEYRAVFMTAAVSDYRPTGVYEILDRQVGEEGEVWRVRGVQAGKVKGSYPRVAVAGERTEKLVDLFRTEWAYRGFLVKFKLEVGVGAEELIRIGEASRLASGADYLVANTLEMVEGEGAGAYLLGGASPEWVPRARLAERMVELVRRV